MPLCVTLHRGKSDEKAEAHAAREEAAAAQARDADAEEAGQGARQDDKTGLSRLWRLSMKKIIPGSPSASKPDLGPMKKPPIGKPMAKAGNGKKTGRRSA
jgi:hypothetical protein